MNKFKTFLCDTSARGHERWSIIWGTGFMISMISWNSYVLWINPYSFPVVAFCLMGLMFFFLIYYGVEFLISNDMKVKARHKAVQELIDDIYKKGIGSS